MKRLFLFLLACAALPAQVAVKANEGYATPEGRERIANNLGGPGRDERQKPKELVDALGLRPGMTVLDLGTGVGYMLPWLSRAVGPNGRVVAQDIQRDFLAKAEQRAKEHGLTNVTFVEGTATDPKLPENAADLIFILDVYHHFDYPQQMLKPISKALRDGGRLVIVDYYRRPGAMPRGDALEHIRADAPEVIREIESAGFKLVSQGEHIPNSQYMLFFERAAGVAVSAGGR